MWMFGICRDEETKNAEAQEGDNRRVSPLVNRKAHRFFFPYGNSGIENTCDFFFLSVVFFCRKFGKRT